MEGWRRDMYADQTGLPWVLPSPNIPTVDSAVVYPGTVLFEGTNVSEGRGTTRPFELVGAPWMDGERCADAMNRLELPGVRFRPAVFEPTFHKHAKTSLRRLPDSRARSPAVSPGRNGRRAGRCVSMRPEEAASRGANRRTSTSTRSCRLTSWRDPPISVEQIEAGVPAREIARSWEAGVRQFDADVRARFLAY